jgi:transcriptional regulator with XRE-family HTH domain
MFWGMETTQKTWDRLTVTRELRGLRKIELARLVIMESGKHISPQYLNDLESGHREPNPSVTLKIARALNVPLSFLEKEDRIEGRDAA